MSERLVHDALAQHTTDFAVERRLHDVRPHAVYEVRFEGERAVCKVAAHPEGTPRAEAAAMSWVGEHTSVPVPEVLAVGPDHFVSSWHDGVPQASDELPLDETRARAMGRGLATLHAESASAFDATGRLRGGDADLAVDADDRWSDTLLALLADRRAFLIGRGHGDVAAAVADWVRDHRGVFDAVDDAVLVHGNWLPDAVGLDRDGGRAELACVTDFEHALVGSPEWDYLRAATPMFAGPAAELDEAVFREAYESVRPLPDGFDDRRRALQVVNAVSYLRSLYLQRGDRDSLHAVARRARRLRRRIRELLADLGGEPP